MTGSVNHARRNLFTGRAIDMPPPVRPPWTSEASVTAACSGCGACAEACPERIIVTGAGGLPQVDFGRGECTFCGACAEVCPEPVFSGLRRRQHGFAHTVAIGASCLARHDVFCRSCQDVCPESAIGFAPRVGRPGTPDVDADVCTGCGACVAACPAGAISTFISAGADHG